MRTWIASLLFLLSAAWFAAAQPPAGADPGKIVIRPGGKGAEPVGPGGTTHPTEAVPDKAGFIVIRPNGKGVTTTQVTEPKQPVVAGPPVGPVQPAPVGALGVP